MYGLATNPCHSVIAMARVREGKMQLRYALLAYRHYPQRLAPQCLQIRHPS